MALAITAYFLIPAYTLLFAGKTSWLETNFSVIGNMVGREAGFVLWGLIVGIYFFWCLRHIIKNMPKKPSGSCLVSLALLLLVFGITTPYLPETLPLKSFLHVVFSFLAAVCLIGSIYFITRTLCREDREHFRRYRFGLAVIVLVSAWLLIIAGIVSSALEIFFTISTTLLVYRLYRQLMRPISN